MKRRRFQNQSEIIMGANGSRCEDACRQENEEQGGGMGTALSETGLPAHNMKMCFTFGIKRALCGGVKRKRDQRNYKMKIIRITAITWSIAAAIIWGSGCGKNESAGPAPKASEVSATK